MFLNDGSGKLNQTYVPIMWGTFFYKRMVCAMFTFGRES